MGTVPISRRRWLAASGALLAAPLVRAQRPAKRPLVGILSPLRRPAPEQWTRHQATVALAELGWIEGKTIDFEFAFAEGREDRLPELARDLVRRGVDLIWARTSEAAVAAARETRTIPIVFTNVTLPVEVGLVDSLARPGRNATGVAFVAGDTSQPAKPLEYLRQLAPQARRLGSIWSEHNFRTVSGDAYKGGYPLFEKSVRDLGFDLRVENVATPIDYEDAFSRLLAWRVEALLALSTPINFRQRQRIIAFAKQHRLPSAHDSRPFAEAGGLVAYGPLPTEIAAQSARHVDLVLRGAKPAELAVELPNRFELTINLDTAKELGILVPQSLLLRADRLIQ
jgi:putative ABC transport system substrate-binding protein